jgi:hypothetical protein
MGGTRLVRQAAGDREADTLRSTRSGNLVAWRAKNSTLVDNRNARVRRMVALVMLAR